MIKDKLVRISEDKGFVVIEQDNKFRSQRCNQCGYVHKLNRKGKTFKCKNCGYFTDSDLNAASNHEIDLIELPQLGWCRKYSHGVGFFWHNDIIYDQECIVPDTE